MKDIGVRRIIFQKEISVPRCLHRECFSRAPAFAQEESRSLGTNMSGIQMRHKMGQPQWVNILGYTRMTKMSTSSCRRSHDRPQDLRSIWDRNDTASDSCRSETDGIPSRFGMRLGRQRDPVRSSKMKVRQGRHDAEELHAGHARYKAGAEPGSRDRPTMWKTIINRSSAGNSSTRCNRIMSMKICHGGDGRFGILWRLCTLPLLRTEIAFQQETQIQESGNSILLWGRRLLLETLWFQRHWY